MRKLIAVLMACMVALSTLTVSVFATDYQSTYNFWNWAYDNSWFLGKLITGAADNVCSVSEDSLHHSTNHSAGGLVDGEYTYTCVCDYCGQTFTAVATNLQETYENETPDYTIDNTGIISGFGSLVFTKTWYPDNVTYELEYADGQRWKLSTNSSSYTPSFGLAYEFTIAVDCVVNFIGEFSIVYADQTDVHTNIYSGLKCLNSDDTWTAITPTRPDPNTFEFYFDATAGSTYRIYTSESLNPVKSLSSGYTGTKYCDVYVPYVYYTVDTVSIDGAPIGGGGSIEYTDDSGNKQYIENQFFDQSTNTYHNPVTDTSSTVESWEYDYSTRTYTGHTENGDVLITYGDENITVQEGNNIYNYYYAAPDGSGGNGGSGESSDDDGESIWDKLGHLLGDLVGGLLDLISGVISGLLDSLIDLVSVTLEKLGSIVDLFGSFGDALKSLWSWLPEDIVTILAAGVSVVVFASVLKLFI